MPLPLTFAYAPLAPRHDQTRLRVLHYQGNVTVMALATSKLTAQGQISVPAEVRRKLGLAPGSVLEWAEEGDHVVVRRAGRYTSEELHSAVFPDERPAARSLDELKEGVRVAIRKRHARR